MGLGPIFIKDTWLECNQVIGGRGQSAEFSKSSASKFRGEIVEKAAIYNVHGNRGDRVDKDRQATTSTGENPVT